MQASGASIPPLSNDANPSPNSPIPLPSPSLPLPSLPSSPSLPSPALDAPLPRRRVRRGRRPLAALDAAALSEWGSGGFSPGKFLNSYMAVGEFWHKI